jgi:hypothetical protein
MEQEKLILNFERGTSRAGNSNENKHISVAMKCNITLNFPALEVPRSKFKINFSCSIPYHI